MSEKTPTTNRKFKGFVVALGTGVLVALIDTFGLKLNPRVYDFILTLYGIYAGANLGTKIAYAFNNHKKEGGGK